MQAKPWYTPFWFMVCILIVACFQSLLLFTITARYVSLKVPLFNMLLWPSILIVEAVIYWLIKKKIAERKWVWAHLLFSLFAFVVLMIFRFVVSFLAITHSAAAAVNSIRLINTIGVYCFWAGVVIGHAFFIVALVRSFSNKNVLQSADTNDILSELHG